MSNHFDNDNDNPLPDWLSGADSFGDDEPAQPMPPPEPKADEPAPEWLTSAEPAGDWGTPSQEDVGYDEWVRQQEEANKPKPIEDEVPDWFQNAESGDAASTEGDSGNFVPDWFMGLEEQSLDDAPDWFKDTGAVDSDSLLDISAFDKPTQAPPPRSIDELADLSGASKVPARSIESDEEVPDWFAADEILDEIIEPDIPDFNFGSPAEPEEDLLPDFDFGDDLADELVLDSDDLMPDLDFDMGEAEGADFADMAMPDFDFAEPEPEPPPPPPMPAPPPMAQEDLDWLTELGDIESEIANEQAQAEALKFAAETPAEDDFLGLDFADDFAGEDEADELFAGLEVGADDMSWADEQPDDSATIPFPPDDFLDAQSVDDDLFAALERDSDDFGGTESAEWLEGAVPTVSDTAGAEDVGFGFDFSELSENDMGFDFEKFMAQPREEAPDRADDSVPDLDDAFAPPTRKGMTAPLGGTADLIQQMGSANLEDLFGDLDQDAFASAVPNINLEGESKQELAMTGELFADFDDDLFGKLEEAETGPSLTMSKDFDTGELTSDDDLDLSDLGLGAAERAEALAQDVSDLANAGDQPEWVADLRPDMPVKLSAGNLEFDMQQAKLADMSDALKSLRDRTAAFTSQQSQIKAEETPSSGILAGITGLSASRVVEEVSDDFDIVSTLRISDAQLGRIDILDQALAHIRSEQELRREAGLGTREAPEVVKAKTRAKFKLDRLLIAVLMMAVLVAPFITDALHIEAIDPPSGFATEQMAVVDAVDTLNPGDYVLLSFDYGPTSAYELDPLAEALLRDIIKQGGIPVITSVSPLGALNSRMVINDLRDDKDFLAALGRENALTAREDYYTLRYVAGDTVGVRGLSTSVALGEFLFSVDSEGEATNLNIRKLDATDFAFIVVIGEGADDSRRWAEQANIEDLPKYLLTTAAAEPLAKAYVDTDGKVAFNGYLAGYRDARIYNSLRNAEADAPAKNLDEFNLPDTYISQWYSISLAVLLAVAIISLGLIINLVRRIGGRSK